MYRIHRAVHWASLDAYIRSLGPAAWFLSGQGQTVTGSGVSQWDDISGNARHLKQGTDANRPVSLLHSGTNYLYLPGVSGNYASTPDSVANSITGDIDIRVRVALDDWSPVGNNTLIAKYTNGGAPRSFIFRVAGVTGRLDFFWTEDGSTPKQETSSVAPTVSDGDFLWLRVTMDMDNGAGDAEVKFWTSADATNDPDAVSWTQLGTTQLVGATTSIADTNAEVSVGSLAAGLGPMFGKIYRAIVKSGIDGTTVVDFDPSLATDQAGSFVASTGETWTINSTGSKPAQIVGSSRILADGSAHKMATDAFTANQPRTRLSVVYANSWTSGDFLDSGTAAEAGLTQTGSTPSVSLNAGSAAAANTGLTLGAWHVVCEVINGASSSITVDNGAETTGNAGANNPGGIALFSNQAGSGYFNGMIREYIDLPIALDATQRARIVAGLMARHGVA